MTVQTDLQTALDAYIQSQFQGILPEISASKLPLAQLLKIQQTLSSGGGGNMTVQTDLSNAIDAYIQANFQGTLPEISASKLPLAQLLEIQQTLSSGDGGSSAFNKYQETISAPLAFFYADIKSLAIDFVSLNDFSIRLSSLIIV